MTPNVGDPDLDDDEERPVLDGHSFTLLLTHDVDRPFKTYQSLYYALTAGDSTTRRRHLSALLPGVNPYWQFETIMALEDDLDVRSGFYFLDEQRLLRDRPPREWFTKKGWQIYTGRYDLDDPDIQDVIRTLDARGWEIGIHGSYRSYDDRDRLSAEKETIESLLGHSIQGGRQHYLNLSIPETWEHHRAIDLRYDTSLGSSETYGFTHGYGVHRPFDDDFVVFPLTIMENALPDPASDYEAARAACDDVLREARENQAVMTVLWHPKFFSDDFPGHRRLYRELIETALAMGAWVGSPGTFYDNADLHCHTEPTLTR